MFDILLLYQVVGEDNEELLDTPDYVIWLMFVFILTGIAKFVFIYYFVKKNSDGDDSESLETVTTFNKVSNVCIAFVLEEAVNELSRIVKTENIQFLFRENKSNFKFCIIQFANQNNYSRFAFIK